jgi:peptidase M28-like protein
LLLALVGCSHARRPLPGPAVAAVREDVTPTPEELRRDLTVFASDSFRGRETGTPDERRAAQFLVTRLTELALLPAGDTGFYQRVPLLRQSFGAGTEFSVSMHGRTVPLPLGDALLPVTRLGPGGPSPRRVVDGALVFAGYGIPGAGRVNALDALPVAGNVVVVVNGAPADADAARRAELESPSAIGARVQRLAAKRPAAVVVLLSGASAALYAALRTDFTRSLTAADRLPSSTSADSQQLAPMILLGLPTPGSPLLPVGWPANTQPRMIGGRQFHARVDVSFTRVTSYNVVAIIRGRDSALADSYVAFGAHYDHIGIQPAQNGDSIANGADDDGSGSVTLLALARAFSQAPRPRRSVLFVWHVGEEKGLLGSDYFTNHPTVPIDSIVAQLNADMIGRNAPDSLYIVGPMATPNDQSRALGMLLDSVNATLSQPFAFNRAWDSPTHPQRIYYRSDHYNYARKGIPILFFTTGLHEDYHRVTDEAWKIDYVKLAHVDELMFRLGEAIANRDTRPR